MLNTYLMSYSNANYNYTPFVQVRYDDKYNSYTIKIKSIIYSDSGGNNFANNGDPGTVIIYYI